MNSFLRVLAVTTFAAGAVAFAQSSQSVAAATNGATQSTISSHTASANAGATTGAASRMSKNSAAARAADSSAAGAQSNLKSTDAAARSMTSVQSELTGKLDSRNASVGQEVTARTTQAAKLSDGTALPKGTKLVGHVTEVQTHDKAHADSALAIAFDRAELRDGRAVPLHSVMQAIAPPPSISASGAGDDDMMAGAMAGPVGGSGAVSTGGRGGLGVGGGGLLGGAGSAVHSTGAVAGSALATTTHDTGAALNASANTAARTASAGAHPTAIPGIMLSGSASSETSGTLTAAGKNISLDSGTQMTLGLFAQ